MAKAFNYRRNKRNAWLGSLLPIFLVCVTILSYIAITGAWFTDTSEHKGEMEKPSNSLSITINNEITTQAFEVSTSDLSKTLSINIPASTNVEKQVLRVMVSVSWPTDHPIPSASIIPNYSSDWTRGYNFLVEEGIFTEEEAGVGANYYYYNNIVTPNSTITGFTSFRLPTGADATEYEGLIATVTVYVEIAPASDYTLDTLWTSDIGEDGSAPADWVTTIKNKRDA